ncbi:MAG: antibiotic biosynthesis monooxygenase [Myxococcota bacterium]
MANATVKVGIWVRLEAKPERAQALQELLTGALPLAQDEAATLVWFAVKLGPTTYGVFDAFADEAGRQAHTAGRIAAALMAHADELLAQPPKLEMTEVLAAKLP